MRVNSWKEFVAYIVILLVVVAIGVGVSLVITNSIQSKMDGGLIIDKYMTEGHYVSRPYYTYKDRIPKTETTWVPTSYTLVVQKEIKGNIKVREVKVNIEKYYTSEVGGIYEK